MKPIINLFFAVALMVTSYTASGQTVDLTIESSSIETANQTIDIGSTIVVTGSTFDWTQLVNNDTENNAFSIDSTSGTWDETSNTGQLDYTLTQDNIQYSFSLIGNASGMSATLSFTNANSQTVQYVFPINAISYQ